MNIEMIGPGRSRLTLRYGRIAVSQKPERPALRGTLEQRELREIVAGMLG
jgi:hypothetical protein